MLNFFRKIRLSLLGSNSTGRYLLYAVGEILLVVVGILIALQINNWNETRKNRAKELKALIDLKEEFAITRQRITEKQTTRMVFQEPLDNYLDLIAEGKATHTDHLQFVKYRKALCCINPSLGVLKTLISSGDINLITNDSLKYLLTDWIDQMGNLLENEQHYTHGTRRLNAYTFDHFPHRWYDWPGWSPERLESNFQLKANNLKYWNRLIEVKGGLAMVITLTEEILARLDKIVGIIEMEIEQQR